MSVTESQGENWGVDMLVRMRATFPALETVVHGAESAFEMLMLFAHCASSHAPTKEQKPTIASPRSDFMFIGCAVKIHVWFEFPPPPRPHHWFCGG